MTRLRYLNALSCVFHVVMLIWTFQGETFFLFFLINPRLVVLNHPVMCTNPPHNSFALLLPREGAMAPPDLYASIFNSTVFFLGGGVVAAEARGDTHRTRCGRERTLCSARRRLETVWRSWCMAGTSESQSSQSSSSGGSTSSSPRIPLRETQRETRRVSTEETGRGATASWRISHLLQFKTLAGKRQTSWWNSSKPFRAIRNWTGKHCVPRNCPCKCNSLECPSECEGTSCYCCYCFCWPEKPRKNSNFLVFRNKEIPLFFWSPPS